MFRRLLWLPAFAALSLVFPAQPASAQEPETETVAPAHVAFVEGSVVLERDGRSENSPLNMPLLSGDRLRTLAGRVEIQFGDESTLFVDERTTLDFQSDDLLRLIDGRIRLSIPRGVQDVSYRIDSPAGSARVTQPGEYRIAILRGDRETQLELAVLRGGGDIFTEQGSTPVRAGERAYASAGLAPSYPYAYNSANWDDFDRWAEARRDAQLGVSAQYLPPDMRTYAPVLDEYGDWRYQSTYGYVWYPRVDVGWRPYYYGRWISYPRYGWTWVGIDRFGWPTHHYGRWGYSAGAWFWIPGSHWSPAWVSWAYAPGYVSWCPLGFDDRPIFAINVNIGNRFYSPWTVVAAPHFGYGYVNQRVILIDRVFDRGSRPVFVPRSSSPAIRDVAVPRGSVPIRWAGSRRFASPGDGTPAPSRAGSRDTYFTRDSVQREHAVERGAGAPVPAAPARSNEGAGTRSGGTRTAPRSGGAPIRRDVNPNVAVPRAVPRGPASESTVRPSSERAPEGVSRQARPSSDPGVTARPAPRTAPEGAVRHIGPREYATPRERPGRDGRQPSYGAPSYSAPPAPVMRAPAGPDIRRSQPQVYSPPAPREPIARERVYAPRETARPGMAVPRESAPSRGEMRAYEPRPSMPPPAPSRSEPRIEPRQAPPPRPAAPERAVPRQESRPSSQSAPPPRRNRG